MDPSNAVMRWRDLPNLITLARIISVVPLAWLIALDFYGYALALALAAGASDAIDGLLAKRFDWISRLGGVLDPIADKLMLVGAFIVLTAKGYLPLWLLGLIIARDVLIVAGGLAYHYLIEPFEAEPKWSSKLNTLVQILLVLGVLLQLTVAPEAGRVIEYGVWVTAATTVVSGLEYVVDYGWRAVRRTSDA